MAVITEPGLQVRVTGGCKAKVLHPPKSFIKALKTGASTSSAFSRRDPRGKQYWNRLRQLWFRQLAKPPAGASPRPTVTPQIAAQPPTFPVGTPVPGCPRASRRDAPTARTYIAAETQIDARSTTSGIYLPSGGVSEKGLRPGLQPRGVRKVCKKRRHRVLRCLLGERDQSL